MRILAAPKSDDPRPDGFVSTVPGEMLCRPPLVCDSGRNGTCGCERAWCGLTSDHGTTVAEVVEHDIEQDEYLAVIAGFLADQWAWPRADAEEEACFLAEIAADYDAGALVALIVDGDSHRFEEIEA